MKTTKAKVKCPNCGNAMDPINLNPTDQHLKIMTRVYKAQRYICHACWYEKRTFARIRTHLANRAVYEHSKN